MTAPLLLPRSKTCAPLRERQWKKEPGDSHRALTIPRGHSPAPTSLSLLPRSQRDMVASTTPTRGRYCGSTAFLLPGKKRSTSGGVQVSPFTSHTTDSLARASGVTIDYIGLVEGGRDEGMDVTFDCYSYPYSGTTLLMLIPNWTMDGGPERAIAAFKDSDDRDRIRREVDHETLAETWLTNFKQPHNMEYDGKSITEIAHIRSQDPVDAIMDLLVDENLSIHIVGTGTNQHTLPAFVSHPYGIIASDAILLGEYQNPRSYGCFPIVLAEFVRAEKHLRLPEAIRKMTSFPAQRLGLPDRGVLRDGFKADIVVFDPDTVRTDAVLGDPKHYPVGIDYVIVNGEVVIDDGEHTGALPGRALRRGKPS